MKGKEQSYGRVVEWKNNMALDKFQEVTDRIVLLLERGVKPWEKPWYSLNFQNLITGHIYSGWNPLICATDMCLYNYSLPFFVGFAQAKDKGWNVKKGAKSTWIKFSSAVVKKEEEEGGEKVDKTFRFAKWLQVFNIDCLDDTDADEKIATIVASKEKPSADPVDKIAAIDRFIQSHNPTIGYGGDKACYVPSTDKIQMPDYKDFTSAEGFYATLLHELTHWTGHSSRCNRSLGNGFGTHAYAYEELIAELGAAFLSNHFGITSTLENHASYLEGWLKVLKKDSKALFKAMKEATRSFEFLTENSLSV